MDPPKRYYCPQCTSSFTRPQHVVRHMRSHTGERPYNCKECGDRFSRSDLLSRHVNKCHPDVPVNRHAGRPSRKRSCDQCTQSRSKCDYGNPCGKCTQLHTKCSRAPKSDIQGSDSAHDAVRSRRKSTSTHSGPSRNGGYQDTNADDGWSTDGSRVSRSSAASYGTSFENPQIPDTFGSSDRPQSSQEWQPSSLHYPSSEMTEASFMLNPSSDVYGGSMPDLTGNYVAPSGPASYTQQQQQQHPYMLDDRSGNVALSESAAPRAYASLMNSSAPPPYASYTLPSIQANEVSPDMPSSLSLSSNSVDSSPTHSLAGYPRSGYEEQAQMQMQGHRRVEHDRFMTHQNFGPEISRHSMSGFASYPSLPGSNTSSDNEYDRPSTASSSSSSYHRGSLNGLDGLSTNSSSLHGAVSLHDYQDDQRQGSEAPLQSFGGLNIGMYDNPQINGNDTVSEEEREKEAMKSMKEFWSSFMTVPMFSAVTERDAFIAATPPALMPGLLNQLTNGGTGAPGGAVPQYEDLDPQQQQFLQQLLLQQQQHGFMLNGLKPNHASTPFQLSRVMSMPSLKTPTAELFRRIGDDMGTPRASLASPEKQRRTGYTGGKPMPPTPGPEVKREEDDLRKYQEACLARPPPMLRFAPRSRSKLYQQQKQGSDESLTPGSSPGSFPQTNDTRLQLPISDSRNSSASPAPLLLSVTTPDPLLAKLNTASVRPSYKRLPSQTLGPVLAKRPAFDEGGDQDGVDDPYDEFDGDDEDDDDVVENKRRAVAHHFMRGRSVSAPLIGVGTLPPTTVAAAASTERNGGGGSRPSFDRQSTVTQRQVDATTP